MNDNKEWDAKKLEKILFAHYVKSSLRISLVTFAFALMARLAKSIPGIVPGPLSIAPFLSFLNFISTPLIIISVIILITGTLSAKIKAEHRSQTSYIGIKNTDREQEADQEIITIIDTSFLT